MVCDWCNYFSFWAFLCTFTHLTTQKIKMKKMNKTPGDIIILHMYTKSRSDDIQFLRYSVWQIKFLFLILGYVFPFDPLNSPKHQNFEKMKKALEISSFYICVPKIMIRWCIVPEIWCMTDVIIFHFGPFFALLPPNSPKNQN